MGHYFLDTQYNFTPQNVTRIGDHGQQKAFTIFNYDSAVCPNKSCLIFIAQSLCTKD